MSVAVGVDPVVAGLRCVGVDGCVGIVTVIGLIDKATWERAGIRSGGGVSVPVSVCIGVANRRTGKGITGRGIGWGGFRPGQAWSAVGDGDGAWVTVDDGWCDAGPQP